VDELRDLPITKTDILLTHYCHWAETSTIVIERKRCDERIASGMGGKYNLYYLHIFLIGNFFTVMTFQGYILF